MNRRELLAGALALAAVPAAAGVRQITDPITVEGMRDLMQALLDDGLDGTITVTFVVDGSPDVVGAPLILRTATRAITMQAGHLESRLHWQRHSDQSSQTVIALA